MASEIRFWIVMALSGHQDFDHLAHVRHDSRVAAEDAAKHLAERHLGQTFVALEPFEAFRSAPVRIEKVWLDYPARDEAA